MAFYNTQLFPPVVPSSLPSYDGLGVLKVYFKTSVANYREQFKHIQITVNRLDSNLNALNTIDYPIGIIFVKDAQIFLDTTVNMYYVLLPAHLLALDVVYKLQVRVGAQDLNDSGNSILNHIWLNTPAVYTLFSEWSTVCLIKPITIPFFSLVGFTSKDSNGNYVQPVYAEAGVNIINTPGFLFAGQYDPLDSLKEETLSSYSFVLYEDNGTTVEASWKVVLKSEVQHSSAIQYSFDYVLEKGKNYYVKFIVVSKNGYTASKIYKALVMYPEINLYNTLVIEPKPDFAKISLKVVGKQLMFIPTTGTTIEPMKDATVPESILLTHMIINGTVKETQNLTFFAINGKWVVQLRALGIKPMATRALALRNPFLVLEENQTTAPIRNIIKVCAVKRLVSFARETTLRYENSFLLVKECWKGTTLVFRQERYVSLGLNKNGSVLDAAFPITPMTEYYFYIKEDNGFMDFDVKKIRVSTNTELQTHINQFSYNN